MNRSWSARVLAVVALTVFVSSCEPDSLKKIIEKKFKDFTGLETAIGLPSIVGLQPAPGFSNLHCCWVGDTSPWKEIAGSWSVEKKTKVNAGITGLIKAVGVDISATSVSYVEARAEPFYRQQLLNIRHFTLALCTEHDSACAREICTDSLKAGKVTVTSYIEWEGSVGVEAVKVDTVKIGNKEYTKDVQEARDIIVGYKMEQVRCGPGGVSFGDDKSPSADPRPGETYAEHVRQRYVETDGDVSRALTYPLRPASPDGKIVTPPDTAASLITARPDGVIGGQVIRVSTADSDGRPVQSVTGIVVAETDSSGSTTTRVVATDANGGSWLFVPETATLVTISHGGEEIFRSEPGPAAAIPEEPPVIVSVTPFRDEAPPGIVQTGSMIEIEGRNFGSVGGVQVNGDPVNVVATGDNWAVAEFDAVGPATVQVDSVHGLDSDPVEVEGVSIVVEQAPPSTILKGQSSAVVLRIIGSERPLPITFVADNTVVTLTGGASTLTLVSSGGPQNTVRVPVTAIQSGAYTINYTLVAEGDAD